MLILPPRPREPDCNDGEKRRQNVNVEDGTRVSGAQVALFRDLSRVHNSGAKVEDRARDARAQRIERP
jgi:hypothetical protein